MSYNKLSPYATTIQQEDGWYKVVYHSTTIVKWNESQIILDTGGWFSVTTKKKMNQASNQFNLGFGVYQKDRAWFVEYEYKVHNPVCNADMTCFSTKQFVSDVMIIDRH